MPLSKEDYYKVLQVDSAADPDFIAVAYKRLALKYHPDTNPSPDATRPYGQKTHAASRS
jgi:DnaJ-class molecular chaperone